MKARWTGWAPGRDSCRISLTQYRAPGATFDANVEQQLRGAASCAGDGCRAGDGDGYQLELSVLGKDSWAQYDLVTGTPLGSVGPAGGYYSGWLNGGVHRLLDSGRATAN